MTKRSHDFARTADAESPTTILIGFADALSAPEVLWSLSEAGFHVVAFAKWKSEPALLKSRLVEVEYIADPAESVDDAVADLEAIIQRLGTPIVMPLDDLSLWLTWEISKRRPLRVAGPLGQQANVALDKRMQLDAAARAGFSVPETIHLQAAADAKMVLSFPQIVKPALAARVIWGRLGRGKSSIVGDAEELKTWAGQWHGIEPMLAQPVLDGVGEGVFGLALNSGVVCWSGHRRLRMMNPSGSGASACVSSKPDPKTVALTERFIRSIRWRGMFMVELLRDRSGQLWFIEINGRPWGSMALARRMGFEYPAWTVRSLLDPAFVPSKPLERRSLVCRHLGRELLHLAFVWRGPRSRATPSWPSRLTSLRQVLSVRRGESWYNWNRNDRRVFCADAWQTLKTYLHPVGGRSVINRLVGRFKRRAVRYSQEQIRANGHIEGMLAGCKNILFLCYGNINRSALAQQYLKQLLGPWARVSSCGFHSHEGRPIDPMMHSMAAEFGVDFPKWSSRRIDKKLVADADFIFAMEASHLVRLFSEYPESRGRAFLLSCVTPPKTIPLEIADPFGGAPESYKRCIKEVLYATTAISKGLKKSECIRQGEL